ncbi:MAG: glucan biosynthesis protein, partial [Burkholderiaceae bacterium]|nr:glucan biosynthesis protein [Burkholderiaceae bacterium]
MNPGRRVLCLLALLATSLGVRAFGFDDVALEAAALARQPYQAAPASGALLAGLSYDDYRDIRLRPERSRWRDSGSLFQLQFFPLGRGYTRPLRLFEVEGGQVRALVVPASDFQAGRVAGGVQPLPGAAGWRLSFPLNRADRQDELI